MCKNTARAYRILKWTSADVSVTQYTCFLLKIDDDEIDGAILVDLLVKNWALLVRRHIRPDGYSTLQSWSLLKSILAIAHLSTKLDNSSSNLF